MERERQNFFSFWTNFCPFSPPPPNNLKTKNLKKWKKLLRISSFYTSVPRIVIMFYTLPEIWRVRDVTVIFYPRTAQIKIKKKIKKAWRYHHFTHVYQKLRSDDGRFLRWVREGRTDRRKNGWTDGRKKWHIGGCHLKNLQLNHSCKGFELTTDHSCQLKKLILAQAFFIALAIINF